NPDMGAVYSRATKDVEEQGKAILDKYHPEFAGVAPRIDYVFANATVQEDGTPTGPALTHNGYPAAALARIIPIKDRVMGRGDCEIVIDADQWPLLTEEEQNALLDHELEHFVVCRDKYGQPILDDANRPKLKLKKHDFQVGWFHNVARRHGIASAEVRQFQQLVFDDDGQWYLPFIGADGDSVKQSIRDLRPSDRAIQAPVRDFVKKMQKHVSKG